MKTNTIRITCPVCRRGRLIDAVDEASAARTRLYDPQHLDKAEWIVKCPKCGNQIGISSKPIEYSGVQRSGA